MIRIVDLALILAVLALVVIILLSAGCVTRAIANAHAKNAAVAQVPVVTPEPPADPPPDPPGNMTEVFPVYRESFADWKYRNRQFDLGEWMTFRKDNVSGDKDLVVHTTVYAYRVEQRLEVHETAWGTSSYFYHFPDDGKEYLFVFVAMFMDGSSPDQDPRMWGMGKDHFTVQVGNALYQPATPDWNLYEDIQELEFVWDLDHVHAVGPYGYADRIPNEKTIILDELTWLRMGRSNKWDGWILYQVPKWTDPRDLQILGRFDNLGGYAYWTVKPGGNYA